MGASQGVLAEDGLVSAEERELLGFDEFSSVVLYWHAHVEDSVQEKYSMKYNFPIDLICK